MNTIITIVKLYMTLINAKRTIIKPCMTFINTKITTVKPCMALMNTKITIVKPYGMTKITIVKLDTSKYKKNNC